MSNTERFQSEALRVNLERTRVRHLELPASHKWLLDSARDAFGVRKRLQTFFEELHHPYSNDEQTVKLLREAVLNDLWFFVRHEGRESSLGAIVDIFTMMLERKMPVPLRERVVITLLEFMDALYPESLDPKHIDISGILDQCLGVMERECNASAELLRRSSWFLKTVSRVFATDTRWKERWFFLLKRALDANLDFWRETSGYAEWVSEWDFLIHSDLSYLVNRLGDEFFSAIDQRLASGHEWDDLLEILDFVGISDHFRNATESITNPLDRTYYILYLLKQQGMVYIREPLLWDLNRIILKVRDEIRDEEIIGFIDRLFDFFQRLKKGHVGTVLDCILTLGKAVYSRGSLACIEHFIDQAIDFGFVEPNIPVSPRSWQTEVDPDHIKNIRVWLEIIEAGPEYSQKLIAALIVNIKMLGLFIADTDLFQRDVTRLLNAPIEPAYQMIRELARHFPVYFNEIGAEGQLRDVTTIIDEHSGRQDRLIHYLRKQVHTESNNTHIRLVERIARFWYDGDVSAIISLVPMDVAAELTNTGKWFEPVNRTIRAVCEHFSVTPEKSLDLEPGVIQAFFQSRQQSPDADPDTFRVQKLIELYQLLKAKYMLNDYRIVDLLKQNQQTRHKAARLEIMLAKGNPDAALHMVFSIIQQLRNIILDPNPMQSDESIYQKRHIAVGIPSMYGRYREPKFEALGLTFRLEVLASRLMDQVLDNVNLKSISAWTLRRIAQVLSDFQKGFRLTGIVHEGFNTNIRMLFYSLNTTAFSIHQYVNLFQFMMRNVHQIIQAWFIRPYDKVLREILLRKYFDDHEGNPDQEEIRKLHAQAERFFRDMLTAGFLVSRLDNFIGRILGTLNRMATMLTPEIIDSVMTYDPDLMTCSIRESNHALDSQIFLGAKGYFLKRLYSFRFPVPEGFILTTEMFRRRVAISRYPELSREIFKLIRRRIDELEAASGKRYGDPTNPLLLSVRSGAAISLPGAMNTFLNVGLNDHIIEELSKQHNYGWTSWDCYRRFLQSWGMAYGINRDEFDSVIIAFKRRYDVKEKMMFKREQMRAIALAYKDVLVEHGVKFEDDPFRQIMQAIMVVMDSWNTKRAQIYRERLQIAQDWGTAVIVQQMVLGNINIDSGTGVVFTHDPVINEPGVNLYGDYTMCSQGEDVVAGLVHTLPISESQRIRSPQEKGMSLEKDIPDIYRELLKRANELVYTHGFGHQEIEFTFESGKKEDLYILQTRDHSWNRDEEIPVFRDPDMTARILGTGIGISKGAMNGIVVFSQKDLEKFGQETPDTNRVLVRPDTVPDDIGMIFECDGLLTARGGAASHAAVTAVRLGKTCVVNCRMLTVFEKERRCIINGCEFRAGDPIAIDGRSGHIFKGHYSIGMAAPLELP